MSVFEVCGVGRRYGRLVESIGTAGTRHPPRYHSLFRLWFAFGFPAFGAVLAIFWLMIRKPALPF